ncbi:hypothetical protein Rsub_13025 [Raphidocelis subcapitata]|uniref:ER membrane protein complex subunit 7 beta-sandwich domain-containing protein n=1 Tax=Raphidocelis subcapitata TaxID=307507 RepID=A0A2V0PKS3_9CHLO|nr:hypothetical protein Rsub_13025 [Raphidocelis subcapitata]|eukprot:GBG00317.1 hypothetical protein Rsub_13025 [Raphidocelis subcapitata]
MRRLAPLILWALACSAAAAADVSGRVSTAADGVNVVPLAEGSVIEVVLTTSGGEQVRTFAARDGAFALAGVPAGRHVVSAYNSRFVFPEVHVDVTASGVQAAALVFNGAPIPASPLVIRPAGVAQYYEARKAVDVVGFIKTPYGLMIAFSVFAMVVMPMMKVDPEEYREAMSSLRGGDGGGAVEQSGGGGRSGGGGARSGGGMQPTGAGAQRRQIRDR